MDNIDKWLKSLRLHKYTDLFKSLTYEQMLRLEESFLIDQAITKGARNKILISVQKLNKRRERLILIRDDIRQETTSTKEALTVLKEMLVTPIPPANQSDSSYSSYCSSPEAGVDSDSLIEFPPHKSNDLTYLFVETFEKVAERLIQSSGTEDSACQGILAAIIDECSKHESFNQEQKARVASYKHLTTREQRAKMAGYKQLLPNQQRARMASIKQNHYNQFRQQQLRVAFGHNSQFNNYYQSQLHLHNYNIGPSLSSSVSTLATPSVSDDETGPQQMDYPEYSLLGPGTTFELPCLREKLERASSAFHY